MTALPISIGDKVALRDDSAFFGLKKRVPKHTIGVVRGFLHQDEELLRIKFTGVRPILCAASHEVYKLLIE